jgi:DNA-binding NtrC family response regulator
MAESPTRTGGRILVVDDVPENLQLLIAALEPEGHEILVASDGAAALRLASRAAPDLILLDVLMPGVDGMEACRRLKSDPATAAIPVIFVTAWNELAGIVDGFRAGAVDYLVKPLQMEEVLSRVATHLKVHRLTRELLEKNRALEQRTAELTAEVMRRREAEQALARADEQLAALSEREAERWNVAGLLGESPAMRRVIADIRRLQAFDRTSVLITGESGTGKELVARAIHASSRRSQGPFLAVNCVAIPAELAESMLFGHVKGSFTGAVQDRKGCFELAHRGTLFLDEIGDMPPALQAKLLRVLEDGCVQPVGASESRQVDVRIIAATNADLEARMESGAFRQDLFFRLARYRVTTPSVRDRPEDIPLLAASFLKRFATEMGLRPPPLSAGALAALRTHRFPGNVRELRNLIERALIESGGAVIEPHHLGLKPVSLGRPVPAEPSRPAPAAATPAHPVEDEREALPLNLAETEDILIQRALKQSNGNIAEAARLLGVHRTRIYRKLAREEENPGSAEA